MSTPALVEEKSIQGGLLYGAGLGWEGPRVWPPCALASSSNQERWLRLAAQLGHISWVVDTSFPFPQGRVSAHVREYIGRKPSQC